jgi:hypothetical protein
LRPDTIQSRMARTQQTFFKLEGCFKFGEFTIEDDMVIPFTKEGAAKMKLFLDKGDQ